MNALAGPHVTLALLLGCQISESWWTEIRESEFPPSPSLWTGCSCLWGCSLARTWLQSSHLKVHLRGFKRNTNISRWSRSDLVTFCPECCFSSWEEQGQPATPDHKPLWLRLAAALNRVPIRDSLAPLQQSDLESWKEFCWDCKQT